MIGVDLVNPKTSAPLEAALCRELFEDCLKSGLLTMSYNPSLRINPPLVISEAEALRGADIFEESLTALQRRKF
jgi:4-aminobutyrate aminotransferase-like enzyme